jgi:RNA polymerase sigma factor (sigma-70 family)
MIVDSSVSRKANAELTAEAFEQLLRWLDADRERAGEKYERIRFKLIKIFQSRGCSISEELADETINRVARKVQDVKQTYEGDPALYFYGVANNIYREYVRRKPLTAVIETPQAARDDELKYECLEQCLQRLTAKNRGLIMAYYFEEKQARIEYRKELAERMGMEPNALWVRMHRLREKLRVCLSECLKQKQEQ